MFKLDKNSIIVQSWLAMVLSGRYTIDQVPGAWGIREGVQAWLDEAPKAAE